MAVSHRHYVLLEVETEDPDLDPVRLQEDVLEKLQGMDGVTVAAVEDRQVSRIHRASS